MKATLEPVKTETVKKASYFLESFDNSFVKASVSKLKKSQSHLIASFKSSCGNMKSKYIFLNASPTKTKTKQVLLTSPSVDSSCRSLRPLTFSDPLVALTSTPLGASMVRVRVGDSSLTKRSSSSSSAIQQMSSLIYSVYTFSVFALLKLCLSVWINS